MAPCASIWLELEIKMPMQSRKDQYEMDGNAIAKMLPNKELASFLESLYEYAGTLTGIKMWDSSNKKFLKPCIEHDGTLTQLKVPLQALDPRIESEAAFAGLGGRQVTIQWCRGKTNKLNVITEAKVKWFVGPLLVHMQEYHRDTLKHYGDHDGYVQENWTMPAFAHLMPFFRIPAYANSPRDYEFLRYEGDIQITAATKKKAQDVLNITRAFLEAPQYHGMRRVVTQFYIQRFGVKAPDGFPGCDLPQTDAPWIPEDEGDQGEENGDGEDSRETNKDNGDNVDDSDYNIPPDPADALRRLLAQGGAATPGTGRSSTDLRGAW